MSLIDMDAIESLRKLAEEEISESNNRESENNNEYRIVYPAEDGKLTLRLLYNLKSRILQRKVIRHDTGKSKVPCMKMYGEDCPICSEINSAEELKGKDCGAWRKYGYKIRGICYAQIINFDGNYFKGKDDPKVGDVVLFMYPATIYKKINDIIKDSGDNLKMMISGNLGVPIVVERKLKSRFPEYDASIYPWGAIKSFEDTQDKTGDEQFDELLMSLPSLSDTIVPALPTEDVRNSVRALSETIRQEYINSNVMNPEDNVEEKVEENPVTNLSELGKSQNSEVVSNESQDSSSGNPDCFGHRDENDPKCMACPYEIECLDVTL